MVSLPHLFFSSEDKHSISQALQALLEQIFNHISFGLSYRCLGASMAVTVPAETDFLERYYPDKRHASHFI